MVKMTGRGVLEADFDKFSNRISRYTSQLNVSLHPITSLKLNKQYPIKSDIVNVMLSVASHKFIQFLIIPNTVFK